MEEPLFADKSHPPDDADLARVLGGSKRHWDKLVAAVQKLRADVATGWKYYTGKYGWTFIARDKRRNVLYLKPRAKCFLASLALGDKALAAAEEAAGRSELPTGLVESIRNSLKYPEGRAVRIEVHSAADVATIEKLVAIRLAN